MLCGLLKRVEKRWPAWEPVKRSGPGVFRVTGKGGRSRRKGIPAAAFDVGLRTKEEDVGGGCSTIADNGNEASNKSIAKALHGGKPHRSTGR